MLTVGTQFEHELKKLIEKEAARLRDDLSAGLAIKDYAQYQNYVGRLAALRLVSEELCAYAQTIIDQR